MFDEDKCRVYYQGKLVITGGRDPVTDLWQLPINPTAINNACTALSQLDLEMPVVTLKVGMQSIHQAKNIYNIHYKENQLKYRHQSMLNPSIATLPNATNDSFLDDFPFIKIYFFQKYLTKPPATSSGTTERPWTGIGSTRPKDINMGTYHVPTKSNPNQSVKPKQVVSEGANVIPQEVLDTVNIMFCFAALTD